jgi:hypothetical protein
MICSYCDEEYYGIDELVEHESMEHGHTNEDN